MRRVYLVGERKTQVASWGESTEVLLHVLVPTQSNFSKTADAKETRRGKSYPPPTTTLRDLKRTVPALVRREAPDPYTLSTTRSAFLHYRLYYWRIYMFDVCDPVSCVSNMYSDSKAKQNMTVINKVYTSNEDLSSIYTSLAFVFRVE